jgi:osmoprotectant transport system permease protein
LAAIKPLQAFLSDKQNVIRIGTKNFTEQLILGELIAKLIERNTNLNVIKKFNLGGTLVCHNAIMRGEIDLYPEYSGTAYVVILKKPVIKDTSQVWQTIKQAYAKKFQLMWLNPFGFNNTNALAVRESFAKQYHLITMSDIVPIANRLSIGVSGDFIDRPDGYQGLIRVYGLKFNSVRLMDPGLMYKAIALNQVDVIMAYSTDGRIPNYHLVILQDDKHLFPPYEAAPIVRKDILKQHPEIINALTPILGKITNQAMQKLNYEVDVLKKSPANVAEKFLNTLH